MEFMSIASSSVLPPPLPASSSLSESGLGHCHHLSLLVLGRRRDRTSVFGDVSVPWLDIESTERSRTSVSGQRRVMHSVACVHAGVQNHEQAVFGVFTSLNPSLNVIGFKTDTDSLSF
tara:strand:- start:398 stop:751 length:354 start_codon:yes stop_codon:yes gene_type:complete